MCQDNPYINPDFNDSESHMCTIRNHLCIYDINRSNLKQIASNFEWTDILRHKQMQVRRQNCNDLLTEEKNRSSDFSPSTEFERNLEISRPMNPDLCLMSNVLMKE